MADGAAEHAYTFRASSSEILFPGYTKVWNLKDGKKKDEAELPPLNEGENLDCLEWL